MTTAAASGPSRAAAMWRSTASRLTPRRVHARSATETAIATAAGSARRHLPLGNDRSGPLKRERNEVQ